MYHDATGNHTVIKAAPRLQRRRGTFGALARAAANPDRVPRLSRGQLVAGGPRRTPAKLFDYAARLSPISSGTDCVAIPVWHDAGDRKHAPRRSGIMAAPDKAQLALRDREDFLSRRRDHAANIRRKPRGRFPRLEAGGLREHHAAHLAVA